MQNPFFYGNNGGCLYQFFGVQFGSAYIEAVVYPRIGFSVGLASEAVAGRLTITVSLVWIDINISAPYSRVD